MDAEIEWGDPPPKPQSKGGDLKSFVAALKERPGEWGRYPNSLAYGTAGGGYKRAYPGTEWSTRKQPDGRYIMWARWVGNGDQP